MSRQPPPHGPDQIRQKIKSLRSSPSRKGLVCLCNDGVLRSFSSTGMVVDYARLSPEEIQDAGSLFGTDPQLRREMRRAFKGVDGYDVPSEKLEFPDKEMVPRRLREGEEGRKRGVGSGSGRGKLRLK
ncbi:hypothetical protein BO94DRAFT_628612 [Aspergillus sclerotioniger CBS 115572]|uniref:Uncharacterized protein n=1 Tax=Aspergillus sclerotioniger CBS 115572 TaxID=1450535 RepID=A0A317V867_9EURO|nr:hypothetical protein BO94DRAFT_628612 [Aspergillus sclerotioniger CBS 115572]PWY69022.1 hypothetical protein BO94DRAFT_628612 [Aspergillus sclerotioniger CBS 115572]